VPRLPHWFQTKKFNSLWGVSFCFVEHVLNAYRSFLCLMFRSLIGWKKWSSLVGVFWSIGGAWRRRLDYRVACNSEPKEQGTLVFVRLFILPTILVWALMLHTNWPISKLNMNMSLEITSARRFLNSVICNTKIEVVRTPEGGTTVVSFLVCTECRFVGLMVTRLLLLHIWI
jgi:hypothetical protein